MLRIRFFNVGDGDAILIEEGKGEPSYRMLVDSGRPRVPFALGSGRRTAAAHLKSAGVRLLDDVVITHLHADHQGGLCDIARTVSIGRLLSGYMPQKPGRIIPMEDDAVKTVRGMIDCVNLWSEDVARLVAAGTRLVAVKESQYGVRLTDALRMDLIVPDAEASGMQRQTWEDMANGVFVPDDIKYAASKARNPASIRLRLYYAGRAIELSGDCYGCVWDAQAEPCDIFKVPHHTDAKAVTRQLIEKLRPRHAVISCAKEYNPVKDRPSADAIALLRGVGAQVWFTDSFREAGRRCLRRRCMDFRILEDGRIIAPTDSARERMEKS